MQCAQRSDDGAGEQESETGRGEQGQTADQNQGFSEGTGRSERLGLIDLDHQTELLPGHPAINADHWHSAIIRRQNHTALSCAAAADGLAPDRAPQHHGLARESRLRDHESRRVDEK